MTAALISGVFVVIAAALTGTGWVSLRKVREEKDEIKATTADLQANAADRITEAADKAVGLLEDRFDMLTAQRDEARKQASQAREERLEALAREARTSAELAAARADKAEMESRILHERHEFANEIKSRDLRIEALEMKVTAMSEEIENLRAQAGHFDRRTAADRRNSTT